jgi:hypothetical protein
MKIRQRCLNMLSWIDKTIQENQNIERIKKMFKKIIGLVLLAGLVAVLLIGAVNRTQARTDGQQNNQARGRYASEQAESDLSILEIGTAQKAPGSPQTRGFGGRNSWGDVDAESGSWSNGRNFSSGMDTSPGYGNWNAAQDHEAFIAVEGELSDSDEAALIFMREEEKLAHDVYLALYDQWGLPIFSNISRSEQSHTEAVKDLLEAYGVPDTASSEPGVFNNPDLQTLYHELVADGLQSLPEALRVGALIEEIDILDLQQRLAETNNTAVQTVFNNLLEGSFNHLRAFTSTLNTQTGEIYQPRYMTLEEFQAAFSSSNEAGNQARGTRGKRGVNP